MNEMCFKEFPRLTSERLTYRPMTLADAPAILAIRGNQKAMKYMDSKPHDSLAASTTFITDNIESYNQQNGLFWGVEEQASGKLIGDFAYWRLDKKNCIGEIGYTLNPAYWGKGFMREAMEVLIHYGFSTLQLHRIEANVNPANQASKKALLKWGFQKEGYFRESYYYNGVFLDSEIYGLLEKDFVALVSKSII